jgi:hypothetical protein
MDVTIDDVHNACSTVTGEATEDAVTVHVRSPTLAQGK